MAVAVAVGAPAAVARNTAELHLDVLAEPRSPAAAAGDNGQAQEALRADMAYSGARATLACASTGSPQ